MTSRIVIGCCLTVFLSGVSNGWAQTDAALPVPSAGIARDVPNAKELPDASLTYKVLFDAATEAPKADEVHPLLSVAARYVNTLAKYGVPADHRKIAVVFHQGATDYIMKNDAYKAKHGRDNPNVALIQAMKKAGVEFHVCGQAVLGRKIDPATIMPEIQLDLWALTTITTLELRGYVRIGGA